MPTAQRNIIDIEISTTATALSITTEEAARRILTAIYSGSGGSHRPAIITGAAGAVRGGQYAA